MEHATNKNQNTAKAASALAFVAVAQAFFAPTAAGSDDVYKAVWSRSDIAAHVAHSREILGGEFRKVASPVRRKFSQLPKSIHSLASARLPAKFKAQAGKLTNAILAEARLRRFDPFFILAIIQTESAFNPLAIGTAGEIGLMQIKPDTAAWICKKFGMEWTGPESLKDVATNVRIGAAYFAHLRGSFRGVADNYIVAYNVGPNALRKALNDDGRPMEYLNRVMGRYLQFYSRFSAEPVYRRIVALDRIRVRPEGEARAEESGIGIMVASAIRKVSLQ